MKSKYYHAVIKFKLRPPVAYWCSLNVHVYGSLGTVEEALGAPAVARVMLFYLFLELWFEWLHRLRTVPSDGQLWRQFRATMTLAPLRMYSINIFETGQCLGWARSFWICSIIP